MTRKKQRRKSAKYTAEFEEKFFKNRGVTVSEYAKIHFFLKKNFGAAIRCESSTCTGVSTTYQWAKILGKKYEPKRENFIQLCRSCHAKMDVTEKTKKILSKLMKGRKLPSEWCKNIGLAQKGINRTSETIEKIKRTQTRNCGRPVLQIKDGKVIAEYPSLASAARAVGIHIHAIFLAAHGKTRKSAGFEWKFAIIHAHREGDTMK